MSSVDDILAEQKPLPTRGSRPRRTLIVRVVALAVVLALALALPYITSGYYVGLASLILATAVLAASVNLLAGDGGLVSLGHAGIAAAAGYAIAWSNRAGWELWQQLLLALALTLLTSALFGLISMRTRAVFFLMVTLAGGMSSTASRCAGRW